MNGEIPDVQAGCRKGRGTKDQIAKICWIIGKGIPWGGEKIIYFCFIDYTKAFDCVDQNKLWRTLKEMGIQNHFIYLLRSVRTALHKSLSFGGILYFLHIEWIPLSLSHLNY